MYTEKVLCIDNVSYCKYPEGIGNIEEFIEYLNRNFNSFIKLCAYVPTAALEPICIEGKTEIFYKNVNLTRTLSECEAQVYTEEEYDEKLKEIISKTCVGCVNYSPEICRYDNTPLRENIAINGKCFNYEKSDKN